MYTSRIEVIGNIYANTNGDANTAVPVTCLPDNLDKRNESEIQLREYQLEAFEACRNDLLVRGFRSSLLVLATGLGKTILFSKLIQSWTGRVLVLVGLEELLQNAYQEIEAITGEILGIERGSEHHLGERIVVGTYQTVGLRLEKFPKNYFSLIIIDEAHHSASDAYIRITEHFSSAKVIGLTATDSRADGKPLPFQSCSYRMGIGEGIEQGYLVPVRGRRIVIDSINLSRVKRKDGGEGDFDDEALDDEMVKGASAIADIIVSSYAFDKGILFFPGCASARLTSELLNKRLPDCSVYVDGKITGQERRRLISSLRNGQANWLCNVGIATEGFNWPEAAVIGMCCPTTSRAAYVQRAGRGTRPLASLLNGLETVSQRSSAIASSSKPWMTILDFVGVSANLNLISAESFLDPEPEVKEKKPRVKKEETEERPEEEKSVETGVRFSRIAGGIQSRTLHSSEEFDPFEATGLREKGVELKSDKIKNSTMSEKQYKILVRAGINDSSLTANQAQQIVKFIASKGWRLSNADKKIVQVLYRDIRSSNP